MKIDTAVDFGRGIDVARVTSRSNSRVQRVEKFSLNCDAVTFDHLLDAHIALLHRGGIKPRSGVDTVSQRTMEASLALDEENLTHSRYSQFKIRSVVHHETSGTRTDTGHYYTDCFDVAEVVRYNDSNVKSINDEMATDTKAQQSAYVFILERLI